MKNAFRLLVISLFALTLGGCVAAGALATAYGVVTSSVGIGQRNQSQDTAEENLAELKGLRADLRRSGLVKPDPLAISEVARDRQIEIAEKPYERSLWERIKRMMP